MLIKESKTTYKFKNVSFDGAGHLVDENAEIIDLISDLAKIFKDECFDMSFVASSKNQLDVGDLVDNE